jgi:hypothetical protein
MRLQPWNSKVISLRSQNFIDKVRSLKCGKRAFVFYVFDSANDIVFSNVFKVGLKL